VEGPADDAAALGGKALKGPKPQGRRCERALEETRVFVLQRLGAWAASEEELKPMRGSRENFNCFPGLEM
jgi:hypothetical protein